MKIERAVLSFSPNAIRKPVTYLLVSNYKLRLNILRAKVMPGEEGRLLLELSGDEDKIREGLTYLASLDVRIDRVQSFYSVDCTKCTESKKCFQVCPADAIDLNPGSERPVDIIEDNCILCEKCREVCPSGVFTFTF
ncbi:4Fe-4S dicluster domain-containing protein [bacterium]|nr:4Fe-4S dicluster domain-containing protein [bacterium]